jgi:hypothetical protein
MGLSVKSITSGYNCQKMRKKSKYAEVVKIKLEEPLKEDALIEKFKEKERSR